MISRKKCFQHYKVMVVMADNNAETVKFIGRREMDMDENMKTLFYVND